MISLSQSTPCIFGFTLLSFNKVADLCRVTDSQPLKTIYMTTQEKTVITIECIVKAPLRKVWDYWTKPEHITHWNFASDDWHSPWAKADFREGGSFSARMEAKDGSKGFDFGGVYDVIRPDEYIEYTLGDGRKVKTSFTDQGSSTKLVESFEAENMNPVELQRGGWQAILDNFKNYAESN
jgi:uncharacterized protein YndB with AHSA1/START domain